MHCMLTEETKQKKFYKLKKEVKVDTEIRMLTAE